MFPPRAACAAPPHYSCVVARRSATAELSALRPRPWRSGDRDRVLLFGERSASSRGRGDELLDRKATVRCEVPGITAARRESLKLGVKSTKEDSCRARFAPLSP